MLKFDSHITFVTVEDEGVYFFSFEAAGLFYLLFECLTAWGSTFLFYLLPFWDVFDTFEGLSLLLQARLEADSTLN